LARNNVTYLKNTLKIIKGEYFIHVQMSSWNNVCTILFIKVNWECSVLIVKFILTVSNVQSFIYLQQLRSFWLFFATFRDQFTICLSEFKFVLVTVHPRLLIIFCNFKRPIYNLFIWIYLCSAVATPATHLINLCCFDFMIFLILQSFTDSFGIKHMLRNIASLQV
jgi:hypothetical protein